MADENDSSVNYSFLSPRESDQNKSFVRKMKSRVSGFIPSSLSKWFGGTTRQREDDDDDETYNIQPPTKKVKSSETTLSKNNYNLASVSNVDTFNIAYKPNNTSMQTVFPEPGPSGLKSRKLLIPPHIHNHYTEDILNGDKDSDSGESTSGYSSMARVDSKEQVLENAKPRTAALQSRTLFNTSLVTSERSLFSDRSVSPQINSSLSSRRPSFNASSFGSSNFIDRTLSTKRITDSPFYNGRTTFGGASAYARKLGKPRDLRTSMRNSIKMKPVNEKMNANTTLSKTARRILDTLEQYTTPVSDAKKIPNPKRPRQEGLISKYIGANPYINRIVPSNKELQVPSIPDLLKMKLKERLQDSTEAVRQIAKSTSTSEDYKIKTIEDQPAKYTNKMKTKISSVRQKAEMSEKVEEVKLPEIVLPISTLPKFDFSLPPPPAFSKANLSTTVNVLPSGKLSNKSIDTFEYIFVDPLVISENLKSITAINSFKFSEPVFEKNNKNSLEIANNFKISETSSLKLKKVISNELSVEPVSHSMSGNLMINSFTNNVKKDTPLSLLEKFKPIVGTWECSECMIRNLPDKLKCAACEAPKVNIKSAASETPKVNDTKCQLEKVEFGDLYKMGADKWECSTCFVRNNSTDLKCVACTASKPTANGSLPKSLSNAKVNDHILPIKCSSGFGDKFKPSSSTWECTTCMIRNKNDATKCIACETTKPGLITTKVEANFGDQFKKKQNEWECNSCMIRNPISNLTCQCCEAPKPGQTLQNSMKNVTKDTAPSSGSIFNFGIDKAGVTTTGFTFGVPATVKQDIASNKPIGDIFGNNSKPPTSSVPSFTFGIKPTEKSNDVVQKIDLPEPITTTTSGFAFGIGTSVKESKPSDKDNVTKVDALNHVPVVAQEVLDSSTVVAPSKTDLNSFNINANFSKSSPATTNTFTFINTTTTSTGTGAFNFTSKISDKTPMFAPKAETTALFKFKPESKNDVLKNTGVSSTTSTNNTSSIQFFGVPNKSILDVPTTSTAASAFHDPFNSAKKPSTAEQKPFVFNSNGNNEDPPAAKMPMFAFGANNTSTESAKPFAFGTPSVNTKSGGFNFASSAPPTFNFIPANNAQPTNIFSNSAPMNQNGGFKFGSGNPTNNAKTAFNFGTNVQSTPAQLSAAQSFFKFGPTTTTTGSGGFNFGTPAPPTFDASAKPAFNFTSGDQPASFIAPTSQQNQERPHRKFLRAARRTPR